MFHCTGIGREQTSVVIVFHCPGVGREQMDRALQSLREEVSVLQEEEKGKLEEEKRKALDRLHSQVIIHFTFGLVQPGGYSLLFWLSTAR